MKIYVISKDNGWNNREIENTGIAFFSKEIAKKECERLSIESSCCYELIEAEIKDNPFDQGFFE
jgi:hypothetical protein